MRTTVELPHDLMKQAKARAAALGESLKTLLTRAVASELGEPIHSRETGSRVRLPLFGDPKGKPIDISGDDIARAITDEDLISARRGTHVCKK